MCLLWSRNLYHVCQVGFWNPYKIIIKSAKSLSSTDLRFPGPISWVCRYQGFSSVLSSYSSLRGWRWLPWDNYRSRMFEDCSVIHVKWVDGLSPVSRGYVSTSQKLLRSLITEAKDSKGILTPTGGHGWRTLAPGLYLLCEQMTPGPASLCFSLQNHCLNSQCGAEFGPDMVKTPAIFCSIGSQTIPLTWDYLCPGKLSLYWNPSCHSVGNDA